MWEKKEDKYRGFQQSFPHETPQYKLHRSQALSFLPLSNSMALQHASSDKCEMPSTPKSSLQNTISFVTYSNKGALFRNHCMHFMEEVIHRQLTFTAVIGDSQALDAS